jgi:hypothetical protein
MATLLSTFGCHETFSVLLYLKYVLPTTPSDSVDHAAYDTTAPSTMRCLGPLLWSPSVFPCVHLFLSPHSISNPTPSGPYCHDPAARLDHISPFAFRESSFGCCFPGISYFTVVDLRIKTMRKRCWELRAKDSHGSWVLMHCACGFKTYWLPVIPFSLMLLPADPGGHCGVYTCSAGHGT